MEDLYEKGDHVKYESNVRITIFLFAIRDYSCVTNGKAHILEVFLKHFPINFLFY